MNDKDKQTDANQPEKKKEDTEAAALGTRQDDSIALNKGVNRNVRHRSLRLLMQLLKPVKWLIFLNLILLILSQFAVSANPAIFAYGIDHGIPSGQHGDWTDAFLASGLIIAMALLDGLFGYTSTRLTAYIGQEILFSLRIRMFLHTQKLSLEFHAGYTSGRVIARQTSDLDSVNELFSSGVERLVSQTVFMVITATAIFILDWQTAVILCFVLVPIGFLVRWYQKKSEIAYRASRVVSARFITNFVETMVGARAVKAFRRESVNSAKNDNLAEDYRQATLRSIGLIGVLGPALSALGALTMAVSLLWAGIRVINGTLSIGILVALVMYVSRFFWPIMELAMYYSSFQSATAALEKISGLLEEEPKVREPAAAKAKPLKQPRGDINFDDVSFGYRGDSLVLHPFHLHIPAGQTVAFVGQTGAGKSTIAKLVARFYDVSSGKITIDNVDVRDIPDKNLRSTVVMVTQESFLFSGTIADNIALGKPHAKHEEIVEAAKAVGADAFIERLPDKYDTDMSKRGGRVSAGQRQLISFARAFLADPAVLILDEATSSMDLPSERLVQKGIEGLLGDRTALIIAHRLSTVAIADRVLVLDGGRIVEDGSAEELASNTGHFAELNKAWRDSLI